ncbi:MAG: hypothetical protein NTV54_03980 [Ignavibacteriales bacterium]|nr:hypothetical protein [Ignavibacteriales bacterium]
MIFFVVITVAVLAFVASRMIFGAWFNHVSLYTGIWSGALVLFELRMINYHRLETETWIVIVACWLLFVLGSVCSGF